MLYDKIYNERKTEFFSDFLNSLKQRKIQNAMQQDFIWKMEKIKEMKVEKELEQKRNNRRSSLFGA